MSEYVANVLCAHCGKDISYTYNSIDYRVLLTYEKMPSHEGAVTDMNLEPPFIDLRFCWVRCLMEYLAQRYNYE